MHQTDSRLFRRLCRPVHPPAPSTLGQVCLSWLSPRQDPSVPNSGLHTLPVDDGSRLEDAELTGERPPLLLEMGY